MNTQARPKASLRQRITLLCATLLFIFSLALAVIGERAVSGQVTISEINPTQSTLDATDPDGATGGRINGLAAVAGNNNIFYAASEWGGLYKTTDNGVNWARLNNHRPTVTWDVEVSPADANRVYATSFYDGRVNSLAGINVSTDGGATWAKPATATPPVGFCDVAARRDEPSAFGISIDPANSQNVYIGTNCGLAISNNSGVTWTFVDPTPTDGADNIWDVVVHHGGIIDVVGDDGHRRSTNGGVTWTTATSSPLPSGRGSITVSPDESYVLFAVVGTSIFESDNGGTSWGTTFTNPSPQGRIPFVAANNRGGTAFDLWFGDVSLHRAGCTTPANPTPGGAARCPASANWAGPFTRTVGGHDDMGDIVFDTIAADDKCPRQMSSDGGVYRNTNTTSPGCHTPAWEQPTVTPRALWLWALAGADQAGTTTEDLYFGCQDNGTFAATNAGAATPTWFNRQCCDGFDDAAESNRVAYTVCCFGGGGRSNRLFVRNQGMTGGGEINTYPPTGNLPGFRVPDVIVNYAANSYALLTTTTTPSAGVFLTSNIGAVPVVWTQIGAATTPTNSCAVRAAQTGGTPSFFVQAGNCNGSNPDRLWRYNGTAPGGSWTEIARPGNVGGFGVMAVDPNNPNRILASHLNGTAVSMVLTTNGGTSWTTLNSLDTLMTGGGIYHYRNTRGSATTSSTSFTGYPQPTLVAFDPADANIIVAGGADSGVFLSTNAGTTWTAMTNNAGDAANPFVPRPQLAYFDHEGGVVNIYVGTIGRGVWRFTYTPGGACPTITSLNPTSGAVGASVTINGTNLTGVTVSFSNNVNATITNNTGTQLTVTVPTGAVTGPITISKAGCPDVQTGTFTVTTTNPCNNPTPITVGQTVNGQLSAGDCVLNDGSFADLYSFNGTTGQQIAISLTSSAFNAYLLLANPSGQVIAQDNDGGGGTNARIPATSGFFTLPATGTYTIYANSLTAGQTGSYALTLSGPGGGGLQFYPLPSPIRLLDTRPGASPNACSQPNAAIAGGTSRTQPARNFCGLPAAAQAITGNVTTVQSGGGYLTLYPSDASQPTVASTNFNANEIINNVFTVGLGAGDGAFKIFALTTTHVVVDVTGYYAPPGAGGLYFHPLPTPVRLLETRAGLPIGCFKPGVPIPAGGTLIQPGNNTCGIPASAQALVGNATSVFPAGGGFLTLFPNGAAQPTVAASNYNGGDIVNGPFTVGLGTGGQFKIYTHATTHLVVDILGYFSTEANDVNGVGLSFNQLAHPVRLLETRTNPPNLPGCIKPGFRLVSTSTIYNLATWGTCDGLMIPNTARGIVGNATVVFPSNGGYMTFWPFNTAQPTVATSNFTIGQIYNRHFIVGLDATGGRFQIFFEMGGAQFSTDLVIDVSGYFAP